MYGPAPGCSSQRRLQTSMYGSYMRDREALVQVLLGLLAGSRARPRSGVWPPLSVPMPPTKSMYSRPSTSTSRAPCARSTKIGRRGDRGRDPCSRFAISAAVRAPTCVARRPWVVLPLGSRYVRSPAYAGPNADAPRWTGSPRCGAHLRPFSSTVERPPMLPRAHGSRRREVDMASHSRAARELQEQARDHLWLHFTPMSGLEAERAGRDRARRGAVPVRHERQALPRLPVRPLHRADRLLARRGARPGRRWSRCAAAAVLHELDVRAPAGDRARRPSWPRSRRRTSTAASSSRAAPRPSRPPGRWPASTTPTAASRTGARSSRARSPTTARRWARSRSPASPALRTPFEPLISGVRHVANTNRYRCKYCAEPGRLHPAVRRRGRRDHRVRGPRDRRHGDHGAGPERRRLRSPRTRTTTSACARSATTTACCRSPTR